MDEIKYESTGDLACSLDGPFREHAVQASDFSHLSETWWFLLVLFCNFLLLLLIISASLSVSASPVRGSSQVFGGSYN